MKHNSDFSHDLELGVLGEKHLGRILSNTKIEVKTDLQATKTGNVFVEYNSRGKDSGIAKTHAKYYCFIISNEILILVEIETLREKCRKYLGTKRDVRGGDSNSSKGILLPLKDLIK